MLSRHIARSFLVCSVTALIACTSDKTDFELPVGGTSGGAGGNGSAGMTSRPMCHQECQDYLVGQAIENTILLLFSQNIAGSPVGPQDHMANCPLGGSAEISGETSLASDQTSTVHLVFDLTQCKNTGSYFSLTFTGMVEMDGTFNNGSSGAQEFTALTYSADQIEIDGELKYVDDPAIDLGCGFAETRQGNADDATLNGQVCDREFSSQTALEDLTSGGSAGSGAAGNGGGSGNGGASGAGTSGEGGGSGDGGASGAAGVGNGGTGGGVKDGLCIANSGMCESCTVGSAGTDCEFAQCCELGGRGFCTDFAGGACIACASAEECDPGQVCCR